MHVENRAVQGRRCLYCGAVLDPRGSGRPQKFCPGGDHRRLFWREARQVGGRILPRRLAARGKSRTRTRLDAQGRRQVAFLIALGVLAEETILGKGWGLYSRNVSFRTEGTYIPAFTEA